MSTEQIKFEYKGAVFYANSPEEIGPIMRSVDGYVSSPAVREEVPSAPRVVQQSRVVKPASSKRDVLEWTEAFLTAIRDAPPSGANFETIRVAIKAKNHKAVGGRSAMLNQALRNVGFQKHHVYCKDRTPEGRVWKPRKQLGDALAAVQAALAQANGQ